MAAGPAVAVTLSAFGGRARRPPGRDFPQMHDSIPGAHCEARDVSLPCCRGDRLCPCEVRTPVSPPAHRIKRKSALHVVKHQECERRSRLHCVTGTPCTPARRRSGGPRETISRRGVLGRPAPAAGFRPGRGRKNPRFSPRVRRGLRSPNRLTGRGWTPNRAA